MTAALAPTPTPIDPVDLFLNPPEDKLYELVEGKLVEKEMSAIAAFVASELNRRIGNVTIPSQGWCATEVTILCFPWLKKHGRRPNVVYYRKDRLPEPSETPPTVAPNLVVEIISPTDRYTDVDRKIEEYLRAGADLVWIVNYDTRAVRAHRSDGTIRIYHENDTLNADPVIDGFNVVVNEFLPKKTEAEQQA